MSVTERNKRRSKSMIEPQSLLIFPCNGNAIEAIDCLGTAYRFVGFVDDTLEKQRDGIFEYSVFPRTELMKHSTCKVLAVPGSPSSFKERKSLIRSLEIDPDRYARIIHPSARVASHAKVGHNVLIMAGAVITSNAIVGNHVCILPNTVVHHDSQVGNWSLIGTNVSIAGGVEIGENCYIGSGSSIKNGVRIGDRALIGLGSTVISDVPRDSVVAGNPARPIH